METTEPVGTAVLHGRREPMNRDLLRNWLGLRDTAWPPDPYALLGLTSGDTSAERLEQQVQARMAQLRGFQLSHPEEATEGMNRVAQAYITVAERCARAASICTKPVTTAMCMLPG